MRHHLLIILFCQTFVFVLVHSDGENCKGVIKEMEALNTLDKGLLTIEEKINIVDCHFCYNLFNEFIKSLRQKANDNILKEKLRGYCNIVESSGINPVSCTDTIERYYPTIKFVVENNPHLTAEIICSIQIQEQNCGYNISLPKLDDILITLSPSKNIMPKTLPHNTHRNQAQDELTILQITDIHYNPLYLPGSNANCNEPVCCQSNGSFTGKKQIAGKWGSYSNCDTPFITIENALAHINKTHKKIDFIYVTGDYVDHAIDKTSWKHNFLVISTIHDLIEKYLPNVPKYPLIGNHESTPSDEYSPTNIYYANMSTKPLYNFLANEWDWLPKNVQKSVSDIGHYTTLLKPGLRLIAINNNIAITRNWWILHNLTYLKDTLQWLHDVLYEAEQIGEKVHILAHIPIGNKESYVQWAYQYNKIVERFFDTISAQFNGHTHRDEFEIFFAEQSPFTPINVAWNGGSISTWIGINPNYRIYKIEPETFEVTNFETWIFNLTDANLNDKPNWFLEYTFREFYGLNDLSPASLFDLTIEMAYNSTKSNEYWKNYVKQADPWLQRGCRFGCMVSLICNIVSTVFGDNNPRCQQFAQIISGNGVENKNCQ